MPRLLSHAEQPVCYALVNNVHLISAIYVASKSSSSKYCRMSRISVLARALKNVAFVRRQLCLRFDTMIFLDDV